MPTYHYRDPETEELHEITCTIAAKERIEHRDENGSYIVHEGKKVYRDMTSEHQRTRHCPGNWPMFSSAVGVNVDQIDEAVQADRRLGAPAIEYDRQTGDAVFSDSKQYRDWCRAHGYFHRNGGYSDATPDDRHKDVEEHSHEGDYYYD